MAKLHDTVLFLYLIKDKEKELEEILKQNDVFSHRVLLHFIETYVYIIKNRYDTINFILKTLKNVDIKYEILEGSYYDKIDSLTSTYEDLLYYHLFENLEP